MVDGKVKFVWSQTSRSLCNCYVCGAKPTELSHRNGNIGKNGKPYHLAFQISMLSSGVLNGFVKPVCTVISNNISAWLIMNTTKIQEKKSSKLIFTGKFF